MQTLAITGLFSPWGRRMARLASSFGVRVLGIDQKPMTKPFAGVEFIEADIRNPLLAELFKTEKVDTVLHCAFRWRQRRVEEVFDSNVLGAMRLLGAAALAGVRKVILPSSTFVYGAHPESPAFIDEEADFQGSPGYAYVRELREIETFVNGFRPQHPEMVITTLRFANILGGGVPTPLAAYLALPAAPVLLGFEPLLQVIHHDDVLRALGQSIMQDHNGVYNVAAAPPLPLLKLLAVAGVPPALILHPLVYQGFRWSRMISPRVDRLAPIPWDFLRYSWVAGTDRMASELGFQPATDAERTVRAFGEQVRTHRSQTNPAYRLARGGLHELTGLSQRTQEGWVEVRKRTTAVIDGLRGSEE